MTVETFQRVANKTLAEYTKEKEEKYSWIRWWPERTLDQTVVFYYRATLWEGSETRIVGTLDFIGTELGRGYYR